MADKLAKKSPEAASLVASYQLFDTRVELAACIPVVQCFAQIGFVEITMAVHILHICEGHSHFFLGQLAGGIRAAHSMLSGASEQYQCTSLSCSCILPGFGFHHEATVCCPPVVVYGAIEYTHKVFSLFVNVSNCSQQAVVVWRQLAFDAFDTW